MTTKHKVKAIPDGYQTVTPTLTFKDTGKAIDFYRRALGAEERHRMAGPDGKIMHAEIKIGNSILMMSDEMDQGGKSPQTLGGQHTGFYLYVEDCDAAFKRAVDAGCTARMPLTDMFWGDRFGSVADPFGYIWSFATHKEDVPPEQMGERQKAFFAQQQQHQQHQQKK